MLIINKQEKHLNIPLSESDVESLSLGDIVFLTGQFFTARSLFHIRAVENNILPPIDFANVNVMVHMGPLMKKVNGFWVPISLDPTTSFRMEKYTTEIIEKLRLRAIVGKGSMGKLTMETMKKNKCIHLCKIGIYGNLLASKISNVIDVYGYEEMGSVEATWVMEGKDFGPFMVDIDTKGQNFFSNIDKTVKIRKRKALNLLLKNLNVQLNAPLP